MEPGKDLFLVVNRLVLPDLEALWRADEMERRVLLAKDSGKYPPIAGGATPKWFGTAVNKIMTGALDIDTGTFKLALYPTASNFNLTAQQTWDFRDDCGSESSGGSGYTAGGFTITPSVTQNLLVNNWDSADLSPACHITGGPFAFQYGLFYKAVGSAATDNVIGYVDFGSQSVTDADINITLTNQLSITAS